MCWVLWRVWGWRAGVLRGRLRGSSKRKSLDENNVMRHLWNIKQHLLVILPSR